MNEASPHSLDVQEDEALSCLDADNPDRWVLKGSGAERGRLNAVCLLEKPVAHHRQATGAGGKGTNPREQFREEVLTVSNKQQEALMKRRLGLKNKNNGIYNFASSSCINPTILSRHYRGRAPPFNLPINPRGAKHMHLTIYC